MIECKRHKMKLIGHRVHKASRGNGAALPKFVIYEHAKCERCGTEGYRERGSVRAHDAREAGVLSGLPESDLPPAEASSKTEPVSRPLTSWPFKVSAHKEPDDDEAHDENGWHHDMDMGDR